MRRLLVTLAVLLAVPATAQAGGWATVGLSSTPHGTAPGEPWNVELEILQHGRTPLEQLSPAVVVRDADGAQTRFDGTPTGEPGVYRAQVIFPDAGDYTYVVDDGFVGAVHTFPPVTIGATAAAGSGGAVDDGGGVPWPVIVLAAAALAAAALAAGRRRARLAT